MACVVWSKTAQAARIEILLYGAEHFGKKSAQKLAAEIKRCTRLLAHHPFMGQRLMEATPARPEIRQLVINRLFALIYYVDSDEQQVHILAIRDTRTDPARMPGS